MEEVKGVYVMAATSRPDMIDPALLRPGRLDKKVLCGFPKEEERRDIVRVLARKMEITVEEEVVEEVVQTEGLSGADIKGVLYDVKVGGAVKVRASISAEERRRYQRLYRRFGGEEDLNIGKQRVMQK